MVIRLVLFFFFFSSRRRHTRCLSDWSSDVCSSDLASLVLLELPVVGWKPAFCREDEETWALAPDYPINARSALAMKGTSVDDDGVLPALGRELQAAPAALLEELVPPFSLVWSSKRMGQTFVQTDGLGQSQLFEFQDGRLWALSNKILAFRALGV